MATLISHLESALGHIQEGWKDSGGDSPIRAVRFADVPDRGIDTFSTLGLSNVILEMPRNRTVRQELILGVCREYDPKAVASFLTTFAEFIRGRGKALLRGEVVGPDRPLIGDVEANAVYCAMPVRFDPALATFEGSDPPTVIVWLVPLVGDEARWIQHRGWERFEDVLESSKVDVDYWNLNRPPIRLP